MSLIAHRPHLLICSNYLPTQWAPRQRRGVNTTDQIHLKIREPTHSATPTQAFCGGVAALSAFVWTGRVFVRYVVIELKVGVVKTLKEKSELGHKGEDELELMRRPARATQNSLKPPPIWQRGGGHLQPSRLPFFPFLPSPPST